MKGIRAGLLAFSMLAPLSTGAWADSASEALARSFVEAIDKVDGLSASAAAVTSDGRKTKLAKLSISGDGKSSSLVFDEVVFEDLKANPGGGFAAANIAFVGANGEVKENGSHSLAIPRIDIKGFTTPGYGDAVLDEKKPFTSIFGLYARLAQTEFESVGVPEITFAHESPYGAKFNAKLEGLALGQMKAGILFSHTLASITAAGTNGGETEPVNTFSLLNLTAEGMDFGALADVFDGASHGSASPGRWRTALKRASYGPVKVTDRGRDAGALAKFEVGAIQLRAMDRPLAPLLDEFVALTEANDEEKIIAFFEENYTYLNGWISLSSAELTGSEIHPPEGGKAAFSKIAIADLSADGLGRFAFEGLDVEAPDFKGKMKTLEIADVLWPSGAAFIKLAKLDQAKKRGETPEMAVVSEIASSIFDLYPRIGRFELSGVEVTAPGIEAFSLGSYIATMKGSLTGPDPLVSTATLKGLTIPGSLLRMEPQAAQIMDILGYNDLVINAAGDAVYVATSGKYDTKLAISVEEAGTLTFAYGFGGLTPDRVKGFMIPIIAANGADPDPMALLAAASGMTLTGVSLRYDDNSLTGRLIKLASQMQGMDEQTMKANLTAFLQLGLSQAKAPEFAASVVKAAEAFLADPKSLTIAIKPPKPIEAAQLTSINPGTDPAAVIEMFGLSVTAND